VSIGTLYNHFPTRDALVDAVVSDRMVVFDRVADTALAEADPWRGFTVLIGGLLAMQVEDRGLNDALAGRHALSPAVREACRRGFRHVDRILVRARDSGQLRPDFTTKDLFAVVRMLSQAVRETAGAPPDEVRRCLGFLLDGVRA
jgi:AcrR family transcriptional regulator